MLTNNSPKMKTLISMELARVRKERKDKNCLNCNAVVTGRFCHICGQENIEPEESVWHLISHFFQDITHFDGKFFSTLKYLVFRPGFLSGEYMIGRRANYLNPVRMYVFTSALFFLIFFSINKFEDKSMQDTLTVSTLGKNLQEIAAMDSVAFDQFTGKINKEDGKPEKPMTRVEFNHYIDSVVSEDGIRFSEKKYKSPQEYDSVQAKAAVKDGWLKTKLMQKQLEINKKYDNNQNKVFKAAFSGLMHKLPQMMFISLPLLALLLKLLYIRRKRFYFVSHGIFCIHLYIFSFIAILVIIALNRLHNSLHWGLISFLAGLLGFGVFFYMYKAMRNFYQQRRAKTILKFILLNILNIFVLVLIFSIFLLFSFFTI